MISPVCFGAGHGFDAGTSHQEGGVVQGLKEDTGKMRIRGHQLAITEQLTERAKNNDNSQISKHEKTGAVGGR